MRGRCEVGDAGEWKETGTAGGWIAGDRERDQGPNNLGEIGIYNSPFTCKNDKSQQQYWRMCQAIICTTTPNTCVRDAAHYDFLMGLKLRSQYAGVML